MSRDEASQLVASSRYRLRAPALSYPADAERSTVALQACPVKASMGVVSRKWTLMIVRDIAYYKLSRPSEFLKNNPGMPERVLSRRLAEMVDERLLERSVSPAGDVAYRLAEKGRDLVPVLLAFLAYGIKHHAEAVFADARPRDLAEVFPQFTPDMVLAMRSLTAQTQS